MTKQAANMDSAELYNARNALRQDKIQDTIDRLKTAYGKQYDYSHMQRAKRDVSAMLGEKVETQSIRRQLRELPNKQEQRQRKPKEHGQER